MKNKLTKVFALLFAAAMVLALTGCPDGIKDAAGTYTTQSSLEQILADGELKGIDLAKLTWKPATLELFSNYTKGLGLEQSGEKLLVLGSEIETLTYNESEWELLTNPSYCVINKNSDIILMKFTRNGVDYFGVCR